MADKELKISNDRVEAGTEAGNEYVSDLESIRNDLDADGNVGTTLGRMVGATLEMTEAETKYMVKAGVPKKVSSSVQAAAGEVKKASG